MEYKGWTINKIKKDMFDKRHGFEATRNSKYGWSKTLRDLKRLIDKNETEDLLGINQIQ